MNGARPEEPGPVELEEDGAIGEYEVEKILNSRIYRRKLQYEVKWEGWDEGHVSWEPAENVENSQELVKEFHKANPDAVTEAVIPQAPKKTRRRRR